MAYHANDSSTARFPSSALSTVAAVLIASLLQAQPAGGIFQGSMISSGRNRPTISLAKDDLLKLCALLHLRVPLGELPNRLGISAEELQRRIDLLLGEGLAKRASEHRVLPTAVVVTFEDARKYFQPDDQMVESAARIVLKKLPEVRTECQKLKSLADVPFESISFFIVSDVLLDNWQISNVERLFVKAERTMRTGGRYYYMILEKPATRAAEPFGIYGNTGSQWGSVQVGLYGNDRFSGHTLLSIPEANFNSTFGFDMAIKTKDARQQLADRMVEAIRSGPNSLVPAQRLSLSEIGLVRDDKLAAILLREADYNALDQVAGVVTKDLTAFLDRTRARVRKKYDKSPYAEETSFNEYLMCWYHFYYTAVTNRLRDKGAVIIPTNGTITYLVVK